jgi:hypothetical protein
VLNLTEHERARELSLEPFYALIAAAMRKADTDNLNALKNAFPMTESLLRQRIKNPLGLSDNELERGTEYISRLLIITGHPEFTVDYLSELGFD